MHLETVVPCRFESQLISSTLIGVAQAGYSFTEEFPIFLLIFLVPAAAAILIKWKFF